MTEVVHGLWIGEKLNLLQILSLRSFLHFGVRYRLWSYNQHLRVPAGVELCDAREILPESAVFHYPKDGPIDLPQGRGSFAGFSDIFRYKVLYDHGGWWADLDVTCHKPFGNEAPFYFREHGTLPVVGNIMRCPPRSELMRRCFEEASRLVTPLNDDWHLPIKILCRWIRELDLERYIVPNSCNLDVIGVEAPYISGSKPLDERWRFFHWMNVSSKKRFHGSSTFAELLNTFGVPIPSASQDNATIWVN